MLFCLSSMTSGCSLYYRIIAKDKLNLGSRAYNAGRYQEAEKLFKEAIETDPNPNRLAMAYYAAAISAQFLPGSTDEKNKSMAERAIAAYKDVLRVAPNDPDAYAFIAHIYDGLGESEKQIEWLEKMAEIPGLDKERKRQTYYSIGVTRWNESYAITNAWRDTYQGPADANDPHYAIYLRKDMSPADRKKAETATQMGLEFINKAIAIDPESRDPYSYLGLLYREEAKFTNDKAAKEKFLQMKEDAILKFQELGKQEADRAAQQPQTPAPANK